MSCAPVGRLLLFQENAHIGFKLDADMQDTWLPTPEWTHGLEFSPDGRWLVVTVESRRLQLWDWLAVRAKFRELGIDWRD